MVIQMDIAYQLIGTVGYFTLGATVYLDDVERMRGGFTVWSSSHLAQAEFFRYHDVDCLPGGVVPFDLGSGMVLLDKREIFVLDMV